MGQFICAHLYVLLSVFVWMVSQTFVKWINIIEIIINIYARIYKSA